MPNFDKEGYQQDLETLNGTPLPREESVPFNPQAQKKLGIPDADSILQGIRSRPRRGTPSRTQTALPARQALHLNQRDFARLIGTSQAAVRNWEQGRTRIPGIARKLMQVIERHPQVIVDLAEADR